MASWKEMKAMTVAPVQKTNKRNNVIEEDIPKMTLEEVEQGIMAEMEQWQEVFAASIEHDRQAAKENKSSEWSYAFAVVFNNGDQKKEFLREIGLSNMSNYRYFIDDDFRNRKQRAWKPRDAVKKSTRKQTEAKTVLMEELREYHKSFKEYTSIDYFFIVSCKDKWQLKTLWKSLNMEDHEKHLYIDGKEFAKRGFGVEIQTPDNPPHNIRKASNTWLKYVME